MPAEPGFGSGGASSFPGPAPDFHRSRTGGWLARLGSARDAGSRSRRGEQCRHLLAYRFHLVGAAAAGGVCVAESAVSAARGWSPGGATRRRPSLGGGHGKPPTCAAASPLHSRPPLPRCLRPPRAAPRPSLPPAPMCRLDSNGDVIQCGQELASDEYSGCVGHFPSSSHGD